MHQAEIPILSLPNLPGSTPKNLHESIYASPEKAIPIGERLNPWELLHHEGYWLNRAATHTAHRRLLAQQIPDDERVPPSQPSASQPGNRSYIYDTYLTPDPHVEYPFSSQPGIIHSKLILGFLETAVDEFSKREQIRMTERQKLVMAKEYMRLGSWTNGLDILLPLWPGLTWRRNGWWDLMEEFGWALRECALRAQDGETLLKVDWELLNHGSAELANCRFHIANVGGAVFTVRKGWRYDIHQCLEELPVVKPKPAVVLRSEDVVSCCKFVAGFTRDKLI